MRLPEPSTSLLKTLAALVWIIGAGELLWKGNVLLLEAEVLLPGQTWTWAIGIFGILLGLLKGRFLFDRACRRNLRRIDALERRRPWDFFRVRFFFALGSMITLGATLSRLARGDYAFLLGVAALDLSIGTALLLSFRNFLTPAAPETETETAG